MSEKKKKSTWGGPRPGAGGGKPNLPDGVKKQRKTYTLSPYIIEWLKEQPEPASQLIETALGEFFNIPKP